MKIQRIITWSKLMALPLLLVACTESTELDNIEQTSEEVYPELDFSCESPSRAVVSSFEPGAKIGVFVTDKGIRGKCVKHEYYLYPEWGLVLGGRI